MATQGFWRVHRRHHGLGGELCSCNDDVAILFALHKFQMGNANRLNGRLPQRFVDRPYLPLDFGGLLHRGRVG